MELAEKVRTFILKNLGGIGMKDERFIEESFPVKEVSEISAKEKNIRHGHISTLHIWWARRPLAPLRATNYAALISAPEVQKCGDGMLPRSKMRKLFI